jgi:phage terminase large subunit
LARAHFRPFHASTKRFRFIVSHRRAGKSVGVIVHMIIQCINNKRQQPPPKYAYVAPSFAAAKDLVWQYLKYYTANIPGMRYVEGELSVIFPHGGTIKLYGGADAAERLRGLHREGAAMDEFPLLNQQAFTSLVRPALADHHGWAVIAGTPMGDTNAFYQLKLVAEKDLENWEIFDIPISATAEDALTREEVEALRRDMGADEFAREMMCSFVTPVAGAYYSESLNALRLAGRVATVAPHLAADVITAWDPLIDQTGWHNVERSHPARPSRPAAPRDCSSRRTSTHQARR